MIDEKKLCDSIVSYFINLIINTKGFFISRKCKSITRIGKEVLNIINSQPKADKWIPFEERLPSEQNQYLVSLEGYCKPMIAYFSAENKKWYWYNSTAEMRYVIAWQPLPPAYKGGMIWDIQKKGNKDFKAPIVCRNIRYTTHGNI